MKKLFLLLFLMPFASQSYSSAIKNIFPCLISNLLITPRIYFTHDSQGNIVCKFANTNTLNSSRFSEDEFERSQLVDEREINISANPSWDEVNISITGDLSYENDLLNIHAINGMCVYSYRIESNHFSIDLSALHDCLYLFHFNIKGQKYTYRITKSRKK